MEDVFVDVVSHSYNVLMYCSDTSYTLRCGSGIQFILQITRVDSQIAHRERSLLLKCVSYTSI